MIPRTACERSSLARFNGDVGDTWARECVPLQSRGTVKEDIVSLSQERKRESTRTTNRSKSSREIKHTKYKRERNNEIPDNE